MHAVLDVELISRGNSIESREVVLLSVSCRKDTKMCIDRGVHNFAGEFRNARSINDKNLRVELTFDLDALFSRRIN